MPTKSLILHLSLIIFFIEVSRSFQVPSNKQFKEAVEKTTGKTVSTIDKSFQPLKIFDDTSFSRKILFESRGQYKITHPLSKYIRTKSILSPRRNPVPRKRFGLDDMPTEYWFDNRIHTFGNVGIFGGLHAACAPLATWLIDEKAYNQTNARELIAKELYRAVNKSNARVLDLCCGVGMSTRALAEAFHDADFIGGIDTSPEMISMANFIGKYNNILEAVNNLHSTRMKDHAALYLVKLAMEVKNSVIRPKYQDSRIAYIRGNAERVMAPRGQFDIVTIMYAFHEIPKIARYRILRESRRLLRPGGILAIVDINPQDYTPSPTMLEGEPYVIEYQNNIEKQMGSIQGFRDMNCIDIIPEHVRMWVLKRCHCNPTGEMMNN